MTVHGGVNEPTDADWVAHLRRLSEDVWAAIESAQDAVAADTDRVRWKEARQAGTTVVGGEERPVYTLGYPVYSSTVERLRTALGVVVLPFSWMDWDGLQRYRRGSGMADAPAADAARMITAILRSERFADGSIEQALDDGTLTAAVDRLRNWHAAQDRT